MTKTFMVSLRVLVFLPVDEGDKQGVEWGVDVMGCSDPCEGCVEAVDLRGFPVLQALEHGGGVLSCGADDGVCGVDHVSGGDVEAVCVGDAGGFPADVVDGVSEDGVGVEVAVLAGEECGDGVDA